MPHEETPEWARFSSRLPTQLEREGMSEVGNLVLPVLMTVSAVKNASERSGKLMSLSPAEVNLLEALLAAQLVPEQQVPVGPYYADFLYADSHLCVEVDGRKHFDEGRAEHDRIRDKFFVGHQLDVLRITASAVWADPYDCADVVAEYVETGAVLTPEDMPCRVYHYDGPRERHEQKWMRGRRRPV